MDHGDNGGGWGVLAGSGVLLLELCVLVPGLLAALLLTAALALPLLLPAIPLLVLGALFFALRGLGRGARRLVGARLR
jgi:hypothetical protein